MEGLRRTYLHNNLKLPEPHLKPWEVESWDFPLYKTGHTWWLGTSRFDITSGISKQDYNAILNKLAYKKLQ